VVTTDAVLTSEGVKEPRNLGGILRLSILKRDSAGDVETTDSGDDDKSEEEWKGCSEGKEWLQKCSPAGLKAVSLG
jgi:hypothetical protein